MYGLLYALFVRNYKTCAAWSKGVHPTLYT